MSHATPRAGGIELADSAKQYTYKHGWIKLSMDTLAKSGGGAFMPDQPGFGAPSMTSAQHRVAAGAHLQAAKKAPTGSAKAKTHGRFARLHAAASKAG